MGKGSKMATRKMKIWWAEKTLNKPFQGRASVRLMKADDYDHFFNGTFVSAVFERGIRTWAFELEEDLKTFNKIKARRIGETQ